MPLVMYFFWIQIVFMGDHRFCHLFLFISLSFTILYKCFVNFNLEQFLTSRDFAFTILSVCVHTCFCMLVCVCVCVLQFVTQVFLFIRHFLKNNWTKCLVTFLLNVSIQGIYSSLLSYVFFVTQFLKLTLHPHLINEFCSWSMIDMKKTFM